MVIKAPQKFVHFIVTVPVGSPTTTGFFMPSSLKGWDQATGAGVQAGAVQYEFPIAKGQPGTSVDYKYAWGNRSSERS